MSETELRMWEVLHGSDNRCVFLLMGRLVRPYVRQTQRSKFADPKAQEYNAWKNALRTEVADLMRRENIDPFPDKEKLELDATITLAPKETTIRRFSGKDHTRTLHPAETQDCDNLGKGLVDALQGALFKNDNRIFHVCIRKQEGDEDHFELWLRQQEEA